VQGGQSQKPSTEKHYCLLTQKIPQCRRARKEILYTDTAQLTAAKKKFPIYPMIKLTCLSWFYVLCFYRHLLWINYPIHTNIFTPQFLQYIWSIQKYNEANSTFKLLSLIYNKLMKLYYELPCITILGYFFSHLYRASCYYQSFLLPTDAQENCFLLHNLACWVSIIFTFVSCILLLSKFFITNWCTRELF